MTSLQSAAALLPVWGSFFLALGELRPQSDVARLEKEPDAEQFLNTAFRSSARNLAVAVALLPRRIRAEVRPAFLACRALDAYEDLSPDYPSALWGVNQATLYLTGRQPEPPRADLLRVQNDSDRVEKLIAHRLPVLRAEIERLPAPSRARIFCLVEDVALAMAEAITLRSQSCVPDLAIYGRDVLGRTTRYAIDLLGVKTRWPIDVASIGRVVQVANLLRDLQEDRASSRPAVSGDATESLIRLLLEVAETALMVPHALASLCFRQVSRRRAAVTYLVATTSHFFLKHLGITVPARVASPLRTTLASFYRPRAFSRFVVDLQNVIFSSVLQVAVQLETLEGTGRGAVFPHVIPASDRRQYNFEAWLASQHPDPSSSLALARASQLTHAVIRLNAALRRALESKAGEVAPILIMVTDYLLACGIRATAPLGTTTLIQFGDLVATLATKAEARDVVDDEDGDVAALVSGIVSAASILSNSESESEMAKHRRIACHLHRTDYPANSSHPGARRVKAAGPGTPAEYHA